MNPPAATSFRKLIKKEYVRAALIPIIIIEIMLLLLYFGINHYKNIKTRDTLLEEAKINLSEISKREAEKIDVQLAQVSNYARLLQRENQRFFSNPSVFNLPAAPPVLKVAPNGTMYKVNNNGGGSIYYSDFIPFTEASYRKARETEAFDPLYKAVVDLDPNVVAVYINTWDNMNRYYPFIDSAFFYIEPGLDVSKFNFYYLADSVNNPSRGVVWTDAYLDPAGQGWLASCIVPVYHGDFLEGVTGIDITIEMFIKNILQMQIPWEGSPMLVDEKGVVLAMPPRVEDILGLIELKTHDYAETVKQDTYKPDDYNLMKNEKIPESFREFMNSDKELMEINLNGKLFLVSKSKVKETGWHFLTLVDEDVLFAPALRLHRLGTTLGYFAILFLVLFYIPFFAFLIRKAENTSTKIISPLQYLLDATARVTRQITRSRLEPVGIEEIDTLSANFNRMTDELKVIYDKLESRIEEGIQEIREKDHMLIKQSRQAAMGEMIGNIAHQWRQPLNSIAVSIQNLEDAYRYGELNDEYLKDRIAKMMELIQYMSQTIDDFRYFFKPNKEKQEFGLQQVLNLAISFVQNTLDAKGIRCRREFLADAELEGYPNDFTQVILNILNNAKEALVERNVSNPYVYIRVTRDENIVTITIGDNAGGAPPEVLDRIFEPYFTTKEMGTGLGLYMSKTIVEKNMEGQLTAANTDEGFEVTIRLNA